MTTVLADEQGQITLPAEIRTRYGLHQAAPVRLIETSGGILLVPLSDAPMSDELQQELAVWQDLAASSWRMFPYEDEA